MEFFVYEPHKNSFGETLLNRLREALPNENLYVGTYIFSFLTDVLLSLNRNKVLVMHICDVNDVDNLLLFHHLLNDVVLFIFAESLDEDLLSQCYLTRPRMIFRLEGDLQDLLDILQNIRNKENL